MTDELNKTGQEIKDAAAQTVAEGKEALTAGPESAEAPEAEEAPEEPAGAETVRAEAARRVAEAEKALEEAKKALARTEASAGTGAGEDIISEVKEETK